MVAEPKRIASSYYLLPPLTQPSVDAAVEFIREIIPPPIFGGAGGRRRRQPGNLGATDQGYLVFYRQDDPDQDPQPVPLRSPDSILRYLEAQLESTLADHWVCTQSTQYRSGMRDGRRIRGATFSAANTRHLPEIVVDLDPSRMSAEVKRLDWEGFLARVDAMLEELGETWWRIVRSSPGGAHVHLRLVRPDGRPLGACDKTRAVWERTTKALCRYFAAFGADPNAVKPTQPFAIPGLPRLKHNGFIPYVAAGRDGAYTDLYALHRKLLRRRLVHRTVSPSDDGQDAPAGAGADDFLAAVRQYACGLHDGRKRAVYDIAVAALAKGGSEAAVWDVLCEFNGRCTPPLPEKQLRKALKSAKGCEKRHPELWRKFRAVPWNRLRGELGMPAQECDGYVKGGRWFPITPRKSAEERVREHYEEVAERLLRFVAGESDRGGRLRMKQQEIADWIGTNRSTLKAVLKKLGAEGRLVVTTKRGVGGLTEISLPAVVEEAEPLSDVAPVNGQSRLAPVGGGVGCVGGSDCLLSPAWAFASLTLSAEHGHQDGGGDSGGLVERVGGAPGAGASVERALRELWAGTIGAVTLLWLLERVEPGLLEGCLRAARARALQARSSAHREALMVGLQRWRWLVSGSGGGGDSGRPLADAGD